MTKIIKQKPKSLKEALKSKLNKKEFGFAPKAFDSFGNIAVIEIPKEFTQFIVNKGSITIDGISLTVASITNNQFIVSIIPHTLENTNLKNKSFGDKFNIETDIIGKYALKQDLNKKSNITMNLLERNGFL